MKKAVFIAVGVLAVPVLVLAQQAPTEPPMAGTIKREMEVTDASLAECKLANGRRMEERVCKETQQALAAVYEGERKRLERAAASRAEHERYEAERKQREEEQARKQAQWAAERAAERARQEAEFQKQQAQRDAEERAEARRDAAATAARKAACGSDYANPRIGMTLERAQQCVGNYKLVGQLNRADGVVSTYLGPKRYLHVMGGQIVAWGER